jgi:radical SAM superfamily enzyme YgiQ (UPF0313 family)
MRDPRAESAGASAPPAARPVRKVLLVHSAHYAADGTVVSAKGLLNRLLVPNVAEMGLPLIAAYTPAGVEVEKVEDYFDEIPWDTDADVVGISAQVMMLKRAVELADGFRRRGKIVVMGGFLPTMHPEEVLDHVDAICVGEGDLVWPEMLRDIEAGRLRKTYKAERQIDVSTMPTPRYDLIRGGRFVSYPVQATRGCPYSCDYCSIIQFYEKTYRLRPVEHVIRDIKATGSRFIHFTDDNLMEHRRYAKELFRAMKGLGVQWISQVTINVAQDEELLRLAYESGCRGLAVGVESLSQKNLDGVQKSFNHVDRFAKAFRTIQDAGIGVHALIVFGFPEDTRETFDETVDFLERCGVAIAEFFIFTPYPKTPAGKRVFDAGLITDHDLNHFRETYVVFRHPKLAPEEIVEGYWRAQRRFYSWRGIWRRLRCGTFRDKAYHLVNNLNYWGKVRRGIVPVYFGRGN